MPKAAHHISIYFSSKLYSVRNLFYWITLFSLVTLLLSCSGDRNQSDGNSINMEPPQEKITLGIYGNPDSFWRRGYSLDSLGVNAAFVRGSSVNKNILDRGMEEGLDIYMEFPTLNGGGYVEKHPDAWAIDNYGDKVEKATWFMGVCPTNKAFKDYRRGELVEILERFKVDGVWLDYLHYHAQFEDPDPILVETCFCGDCTSLFSEESRVTLPEGSISDKASWILENKEKQWRNWRTGVVAGWVEDMALIVKKYRPEALLGVFHCPWNDTEYDSARIKYLALDYQKMSPWVDVFSPMVYHGRMERDPSWVYENTAWMRNKLGDDPNSPKIWPIVQAHDDPIISPEEFGDVLKHAIDAGATGVMMFTGESVAKDSLKVEVMKNFYDSITSNINQK